MSGMFLRHSVDVKMLEKNKTKHVSNRDKTLIKAKEWSTV